jgi:hypothetical protein
VNDAWIGLLGVVAGVVAGGAISLFVQRRQQVQTAVISGRLVAAELDRAVSLMEPTVSTGQWWTRDLPTEVWQAHQVELAAGVDDAFLSLLETAYGSIKSLNAEYAPSKTSGTSAGDTQKEDLKKDQELLKTTRDQLKTTLTGPARFIQNLGRSFLATVAVIGLALLVILLIAGFTPRVDANPSSVASALQSKLGPDDYVDCLPDRSGWFCDVHYLSAPLSSCLASETSLAPLNRSPSTVSYIVAPGSTNCRDTAVGKMAVTQEADELIGTYEQSVRTQNISKGADIVAKMRKKGWIQNLWNQI